MAALAVVAITLVVVLASVGLVQAVRQSRAEGGSGGPAFARRAGGLLAGLVGADTVLLIVALAALALWRALGV